MTRAAELRRLRRVEALANTMDSACRVPFLPVRVGLDSVIGLIPGVGDTLTLMPAAWIVYTAHDMGVPTAKKLKMLTNIGKDWLIGLIPLVGDIFDVGFKANRKNATILRAHVEERHACAQAA